MRRGTWSRFFALEGYFLFAAFLVMIVGTFPQPIELYNILCETMSQKNATIITCPSPGAWISSFDVAAPRWHTGHRTIAV